MLWITIGLVLLLLAGLGYTLSSAIVRPPRSPVVAPQEADVFLSDGRAIAPELVELENGRGLTLRGSFYSAGDEPAPAVVYGHGNASSRLEALEIADDLLEAGIHLLAIDFAGCGVSEGDLITLGHDEWGDLAAGLDWLADRREVDPARLALVGRSMGAVSALRCATRHGGARALVLDSPFADLGELCREQAGKMGLPFFPFWPVVRGIVQLRAGFDPADVRPVEALEKLEIPVLLIHGERDMLIGIEHSERLLATRPEATELWRLPDAGHNDVRGHRYGERIAAFLEQHLKSTVTEDR